MQEIHNNNREETSPLLSSSEISPCYGSFIAISPDNQQIVTFIRETHEFKLFDSNNLSSRSIPTPKSIANDKHLCWSIAISNCVDGDERLIALSCFDTKKFRHDGMHGDDQNDHDERDLESCGDIKCKDKTWVISTKDSSEIDTPLESIGGIIRFLDTDNYDGNDGDDSDQPLKNKPVIVIVNASGIYMNYINRKSFFSRSSKIKKFELPQHLSIRLSRDTWHHSLELLHTSIIKNHFMVHSFENRQQIIEMYSLITGDLEMLFKRHESSVAPNIIHSSSIFAISQNEKILAFCWETTRITLYFMENGLEITTKQLKGHRGIYKIIDINFIDEDSKLLIILEEKEDRFRKISKNHQIFVVWDLFTTFKNSIRQIDYSETQSLKIDFTHRLMNSHGKMFAIRARDDIFSVLDHKDVNLIRTPSAKVITAIDITTRDDVYHAIHNINGVRSDASKLNKNQIIIDNVEPWHPDKSYFRTSVYLDSTESTQLIISSNTIQVWKYRNSNTIEKRDKRRDRVLEYIWARDRKKEIDVRELRIGEREFELKVFIPSSTPSKPPKSMMIHWPNNVNVLEGACRALYVLRKKSQPKTSFENVNQMKDLVECTQKLVRKYITKYGIFRLTSIRYPIMKYLIKGYQESLINLILNKKINKKNSNLYIPRLYKWAGEDNNRSTTEISKSDLHHAILCIKERGDFTVILKYLLDYYADNTKEYNNVGWMFTVSKAIPLLYDYHLSEFVRYLFKKACFGVTEVYTPPLHIDSYDQTKGNIADVIHSLAVKPRLASKLHNTLWFFLKNLTRYHYWFQTSHNDRKVYMVPLPDFTVSPKSLEDNSKNYSKYFWFLLTSLWPRRKVINDPKDMSPFHRVIHEEKGYEIYQTPTIMAILDFKWSAAHKIKSNTILKISLFVYMYTGWYLIVTEVLQFIREGRRRYFNIYNIFDLVSVLLPLLDIVILLMRYFESSGRYIYIIYSITITVWPFFAFMLIAVIAFGLSMFILLKYSAEPSFQIPKFKINDISNSDLYSNITIYQDIDKSSWLDNYYSNPFSSIEAVFFWTNGRWDQLNQWNSLAANAMSILGSIIIVLIFQNMLVAFMNGAFDKANKAGLTVAHRYRAEPVAEYEALEKPFGSKRGPRYIYYIPDPNMVDTWLKEIKKDEKQELRSELTDFDYSDDDGDDAHNENDDDNQGSTDSDKISFIDEEIFLLKVVTSKSNKKSQRNWKSNNKSLKNNNYNEPLSPTTNVDDQSTMQELKTRIDEMDKNLKIIMKSLKISNESGV
ncbi:hypothetical protein Glove_139g300 [Diversispora epigaea]|uniref:Ion transport domain-containing protein n=1 Tax=Diversispora epigaea TaxID=1348612 RepID=A0A397IYL0_9GLOM|nr:hypothetical protein Glove_139g300 [Diversispora epigaea]